MRKGIVWVATLVVLAGMFGLPRGAAAQMDLGGATRLAVSGSVPDLLDPEQGFVNVGASRVTEGGAELGGDISASFSASGVSGFGFFRGGYNFIGESLTVPFVTGGVGTPLGSATGSYVLYNAGAGVKRFIDESASFDIMANYQGLLTGSGGGGTLSLVFGLSIYLGN